MDLASYGRLVATTAAAVLVLVAWHAGVDLAGTDDIQIELVFLTAAGCGVYAAPNAQLPGAGRLTAVLTWLAGTRAGRWLATVSAVALIAMGILARVYGVGRASEESRNGRDPLKAARSRSRTDDQIDRMGDAARRNELAGWVHDDGR